MKNDLLLFAKIVCTTSYVVTVMQGQIASLKFAQDEKTQLFCFLK